VYSVKSIFTNISHFLFTSTIILVLSLAINLMLALNVIYNESYSNPKFKKWSSANAIVVSIFTLIASSYIEALNILQSNFFKAEFSKAARGKIFWGTCIDIIVEDLPQIIILVSNFFFFFS
jgi:hypothetical protein